MADVHYKVVEHDGGWAYTQQGVFSEPYATREEALQAAKTVAAEQRTPGDTTQIEYQDETGKWYSELSKGDDRPAVDVDAASSEPASPL